MTWKRRFREVRPFEWLHQIYVVGAVVTAIAVTVYGQTVRDQVYFGLLATYFLVLLIYLFYAIYSMGYKARYAEANRFMHSAVHCARDTYYYLMSNIGTNEPNQCFDERRFQELLQSSLTAAAQAFTLNSGVACRVSLGVVGGPLDTSNYKFEDLFVQVKARDSTSAMFCKGIDQGNTKHPIWKNTAFRRIMLQEVRHFISGDLSEDDCYDNTFIPLYRRDGHIPPNEHPYYSMIVWPIHYRVIQSEGSEECPKQTFLGFLAVDSVARNAFNKRYDTEVGAILADSLFAVLDMYGRVQPTQVVESDIQDSPTG